MQLQTVANPFKTREFRALFKEWNELLERDGFKDAEDFSLTEPALKSWHAFKWQNGVARSRDSESYYQLAARLFHNGFRFRNDVDRRIWELHCQGHAVRKIQEILQFQLIGYKGTRKSVIHDVIVSIEKRAGIRK